MLLITLLDKTINMTVEATVSLDKQILDAAERLFLKNGYAMTSTTDIAKEVGCNQSLVHYYYRTKERLFMQIFIEKSKLFLSGITDIEGRESDFFSMLQHRVESHFDMLMDNPNLSFLIMNELITHIENIQPVIKSLFESNGMEAIYADFQKSIAAEVQKGTMRPISGIDLVLNVISLNAFTSISLPVVTSILDLNDEQRSEYIANRKKEIVETILRSIRI